MVRPALAVPTAAAAAGGQAGGQVTDLAAEVRRNPDVARERIRAAVRQSGGVVTAAAVVLGVSHRALCRHVARLGLAGDIELIRAPIREAARAARGVTP